MTKSCVLQGGHQSSNQFSMSKVMLLAQTGMGKSSSLRNLPPESTAIINADMKELPLRGWKKKYLNVKGTDGRTDFTASNYIEISSSAGVKKALEEWEKVPKIKTIVIDTITHMITKEYMSSTIGKDFKAYQALGKTFYDIIDLIRKSEKNIIVMGHIERKINEFGDAMWEMKAHGKMITDLVPASYFTTVMVGEVQKKDEKLLHVFRTQSEGNDPAKSPAYIDGASVHTALQLYEDNDMAVILEKLEMFSNEE